MKKSAMQKLLEYLDPLQSAIIDKAKQLITEEKQQIKDAFNAGYRAGETGNTPEFNKNIDVSEFSDAEDYYNNNFTE